MIDAEMERQRGMRIIFSLWPCALVAPINYADRKRSTGN
jgi:hypothetical protein